MYHKIRWLPFTDKPCLKQSNAHGSVGFAIDTTAWVIFQQNTVAGIFLILAPFQVNGQGTSHDKKVDLKTGWK